MVSATEGARHCGPKRQSQKVVEHRSAQVQTHTHRERETFCSLSRTFSRSADTLCLGWVGVSESMHKTCADGAGIGHEPKYAEEVTG